MVLAMLPFFFSDCCEANFLKSKEKEEKEKRKRKIM